MKFRTFAYNEGFGCPFFMITHPDMFAEVEDKFIWVYCVGWKTGMEEDDNKQVGTTELFISHDNQTDKAQSLQQAEKTRWHFNLYEDWMDLFEWQSVCYSFSMSKKHELVYANGKLIQGYKWSKEFRKGWADNPMRLRLMGGWKGEMTDVNIYDSAFEKDEMISWTTSCGTLPEGQILPWKPELYNITIDEEIEAIVSEVSSEDLCSSQEGPLLEIFDNGVGKSPLMSEEFCARLNGQLSIIPIDEETAFATVKEFEEYVVKVNTTGLGIWVAGRAYMNGTEMTEVSGEYTQIYPEGGKWVIKDPYTGKILGEPFVLNPTYHTYAKPTQECLVCTASYKPEDVPSFRGKFCKGPVDCIHNFGCNSQKCERSDIGWALICKFQQKVKLRLKGLCKESKVDTDYLLLGYEVLDKGGSNRRKYGGSTGWLLSHNKEEDLWSLKHEYYPDLSLTMEEKDTLPVGVHNWIAANNTCSLGQTTRLVIHSFLEDKQLLCRVVYSWAPYFHYRNGKQLVATQKFSLISLTDIFSVQLQLSACLPHQFTCHNGKCVSMNSRCDNVEVITLFKVFVPSLSIGL